MTITEDMKYVWGPVVNILSGINDKRMGLYFTNMKNLVFRKDYSTKTHFALNHF